MPFFYKLSAIFRTAFVLPLLLSGTVIAHPVIIHHPGLQGEDLSPSVVVRIYAMQKRAWSDNTPVRVFTMPSDSPLHKAFVVEYLHMQPYQLDRLWFRLVFSGTGSGPEEVSTTEEMLDKVRNTPGGIGYIDSSFIDQVDTSMMTGAMNE